MSQEDEEKRLLPHHEQLPLCATRLPYRQGRKLTAVKVYTVADESNHLLIFGVPSLNLRREAKDLLMRFGHLEQFHVAAEHPAEAFTETYHACYDRIQSARIAKKMLDATNFYGGSLHICYAPELETLIETKAKLSKRRKDVLYRLFFKRYNERTNELKNETDKKKKQNIVNNDLNIVNDNTNIVNNDLNIVNDNTNIVNNDLNIVNNDVKYNANISLDNYVFERENNDIVNEVDCDFVDGSNKLNMGENNVIYVKGKRKLNKRDSKQKRLKSSLDKNESNIKNGLDVVDCTSVERNVVSNINEALNFRNFGNEIVRKVDFKPMNKIIFNFNKKTC